MMIYDLHRTMKITLNIIIVVIAFTSQYGCKNHSNKDASTSTIKKQSTSELEDTDTIRLVGDSNENRINRKTENELISVFNAEVNHIFTYPSNMIEIQTVKYDSTWYFNNDSTIIINKYTYKNFFDGTYQYPMTKLDDIDVDNIDESQIQLEFSKIINDFIDKKNISKYQNEVITKSRGYNELLIEYEEENSNQEKLMLCNVVGGTHAVVLVSIAYDKNHKKTVDEIMRRTVPK